MERSRIPTDKPLVAILIQTTAGTLHCVAYLPQGSEYMPVAWATSEPVLFVFFVCPSSRRTSLSVPSHLVSIVRTPTSRPNTSEEEIGNWPMATSGQGRLESLSCITLSMSANKGA